MRIVGLTASAIIVLTMAPATSPARAEVRIGFAAALTGPMAWEGVTNLEVAEAAVAELNAKGGVLGEQIEMIIADDYCDGKQAIAAAHKLVEDRVVAVIGHPCSAAAIPASKIYANAGILMISDTATNPQLTEQAFTNVFRVIGRDDLQGRIAADLLADRWGDRPIAILHDGQTYGQGLAEETKKRLNDRGIAEAMYEAIEPGKADYWDIVQKMRANGIEVLYFGGFPHEAGLIIRQAHEHGYALHLLGGDGLNSEDFGLIAGPASDGTLMTNSPFPDLRNPDVAELRRKFPDWGSPQAVRISTAPQVWAQAVEIAGTFGTQAVAAALRSHQFDTMLGRIGFDAKGDVTGYETFVWYVWKNGKFAPVEPGKLTE
jgi:branched-chain amino acid transport system substrate-binding protein